MRFLGPPGDAADEIVTFSQIPAAPVVAMLGSTATFSTALTDITGLNLSLTAGTWSILGSLTHNTTGTASAVSNQLKFPAGNFTSASSSWSRFSSGGGSGSLSAGTFNSSSSMGTTRPLTMVIRGTIVVTSTGTLTPAYIRAGSTTGEVLVGSWMSATKVA